MAAAPGGTTDNGTSTPIARDDGAAASAVPHHNAANLPVEDLLVMLLARALSASSGMASRCDADWAAIDWAAVYRLARRHSVEALCLRGLPDGLIDDPQIIPAPLAARWRHRADMTLYQQLGYETERAAILGDFAEAGLSWLPLKGIITATYYPAPGLRSMSDNDLVVGFTQRNEHGEWEPRGAGTPARDEWDRRADELVRDIAMAHGYDQLHDADRERSFTKRPFHFEMHRALVSPLELHDGSYDQAVYDRYANPWRFARPQQEDAGETDAGAFAWPPEEEYLFHIVHLCKHRQTAGFGIRFVVDDYVMRSRFVHDPDFDWTYVGERLRAMGLDGDAASVNALGEALFTDPLHWRDAVAAQELALFEEIMASGTYGTMEQGIAKRQEHRLAQYGGRGGGGRAVGRGKAAGAGADATAVATGTPTRVSAPRGRLRASAHYLARRIYPSREWHEAYHPRWAGSRLTRLLFVPYRLVTRLVRSPRMVLTELKLLFTRK